MKSKCPRHKRMNRSGRLQSAKHWLPKYEGKSMVKGYSKHFGVNKICAVLELRMLGYEISDDYLEKLKANVLQQQRLVEKRKREKELDLYKNKQQYSEDTFFMISGYTSDAASYGLTYDELGNESDDFKGQKHYDELPFG